MKKAIDEKRVVEMFKGTNISIYEAENQSCEEYSADNPCIQYVVNEKDNSVLYRLQSNTPISVQAAE